MPNNGLVSNAWPVSTSSQCVFSSTQLTCIVFKNVQLRVCACASAPILLLPLCCCWQVPLLAAPMAGITAAPLRLMYTQVGRDMAQPACSSTDNYNKKPTN